MGEGGGGEEFSLPSFPFSPETPDTQAKANTTAFLEGVGLITYVQNRSCQQKYANTLFSKFEQKRFKENCYQKSIEETANVAKIAKVRRIFLGM